MRINELIHEGTGRGKLRKSVVASLPGARIFQGLDNSSPYHSYRFGVAMARSPDTDMHKEGPTAQKMVTISYSDAENEIIDHAAKHLGFDHTELTGNGSEEIDTIGTRSPVADWMQTEKKAKKKK